MATDILTQIVEHKRTEIAAAQQTRPLTALQQAVQDAPPVRDFVAALRSASGMALIAEVKKASPSAGLIRADFDPVAIAKIYEEAGAACISCLTDEHFFQGHLDSLTAIRKEVSLPVMRKDFLLDPYQVFEARVAGADCVLLIAECLNDDELKLLYETATELGMHCLIEIYEPDNLERVLKLNPPLVGVNNRNLRTFVTDLNHSMQLVPQLPPGTLLVSESGIRTQDDVQRLSEANVSAILVGETLMRADDIGDKVRELIG